WVPEVDQDPVTEILGDVAVVALNDLATHRLVRVHHIQQLLGVQLRGHRRRADEIAEHDGDRTKLGCQGSVRGIRSVLRNHSSSSCWSADPSGPRISTAVPTSGLIALSSRIPPCRESARPPAKPIEGKSYDATQPSTARQPYPERVLRGVEIREYRQIHPA